jgi:hypothetical protein
MTNCRSKRPEVLYGTMTSSYLSHRIYCFYITALKPDSIPRIQAARTTQADSLCDQKACHTIIRNEIAAKIPATRMNQLQKFQPLMPQRLKRETEFTTVALIPAAIGTDKALYEPKQRQKPPRNSKF